MMCRELFDMSMDEFLYDHSIESINEMVRIYNKQLPDSSRKTENNGVEEYDNPADFFKL